MVLKESKELASVLQEGRSIAKEFNAPMASAHVLLCLFIVENQAKRFLVDHGLDFKVMLESIRREPTERPQLWEEIHRRAHDIARVQGCNMVNSLHMLVSLCSFVDSSAYKLIQSQGLVAADIRSDLMTQLYASPADTDGVETDDTPAPPPPIFGGNAAPKGPAPAPKAVGLTSSTTQDLARRLRDREEEVVVSSGAKEASEGLRPLSDSLSRIPIPSRQRTAQRRFHQRSSQEVGITTKTAAAAHVPQSARYAAPHIDFRPEQYRLIPRDFPLLSRLGRNLSEAAIAGEIDAAIGRNNTILRLVDTLNKRRSNNPLLVGEPGVGKTAIVEGFAHYLIEQAKKGIVTGLEDRIIVSIEASTMVAGTSVRGAFAERMTQLKKEVMRANGRVILFFDELHHWIGAGSSNDGAGGASGELKTALARGEFPCIGATTWAEYTQYIEPDTAFTRRFETIRVAEPDLQSTIRIVTGMRETYETHHGIEIPDDTIEYAVKLAHRYLPNRRNPDKSFGVIDFAGALARRAQEHVLSQQTVTRAVADQAGIDPARLMMADRERYAKLDTLLKAEIVGQDEAVERVASLLQRNYAGFAAGRPIGSFLFMGPTGVGKTEFARALARVLFGDEKSMLRIDMSEYMEAHAVSRLIGAPPGYVGHDSHGLLTEPIRRDPYQLILLDEIEKAHPDILNLLIQVLDEGRLTDSRGHTVDFGSTIVVMTTNLGARLLTQSANRSVGFAQQTETDQQETLAKKEAQKYFRPEIWNRIDETIVFPALDKEQVQRIAIRMLEQSSDRLSHQRNISFSCDAQVIDLLIASGGYDPDFGARPMRRTIERIVEQFIAQMILEGEAQTGDHLRIGVQDDTLILLDALPDLGGDSDAENATIATASDGEQRAATASSDERDTSTVS